MTDRRGVSPAGKGVTIMARAMSRNVYRVDYNLFLADHDRTVYVVASNKVKAYEVAFYEAIPAENDGCHAYAAWVVSVTYQNGNYRTFNTFSGKPY